jgi:uncharacterized protein (UPF0210 family)
MLYLPEEIYETIQMLGLQNLDVRTVTMGISLLDCVHSTPGKTCKAMYDKVTRYGRDLVASADEIGDKYGISVVNKRISVTPVSLLTGNASSEACVEFAQSLDRAADEIGIDYIGGYSALVDKGFTEADRALMQSIPEALSTTSKVCSSINVASSRAGANLDAIRDLGFIIRDCAEKTSDNNGIGAAKFVVFSNAVSDNPFMAGAFHGVNEGNVVLNVGVSGPGAVHAALKRLSPEASISDVCETIKKISFKITRMGELIGQEVASMLGIPFGIADLSLAPTPAEGDSVANVLETFGLEKTGAWGTTMALAILNDAVKKGGAMAASRVGGLSGAFIPVSEDQGMIEATRDGHLSLEKLEAMTSVCSVGLDMFLVPGNTPASILSGIIADEVAIGMINHKTTAVRVIPVPGKKAGDHVSFGGLLGEAWVMPVNPLDNSVMINRGGTIPPPLNSLRN